MKTKRIELDVDFMGSQDYYPTNEEFQQLDEFIKEHKAKLAKTQAKKKIKAHRISASKK